ncbi:MAG TPA: hypothetical protein DIU00_14770 [Phycisphaerales bacterium]|nr:hypothetical protein [Phycisphaerales bacterium]
MTAWEYNKELEKWRRMRHERDEERLNLMVKQASMRLLDVNEKQWEIIEAKYEKVRDLFSKSRFHAPGWGGQEEQDFHWHRRSKGNGFGKAKALDEMTECERIVEALTDLLEDENSTDEDIREKTDALQQARDKAREALPKAKQELAEALMTQRQEAIFLVMGYID